MGTTPPPVAEPNFGVPLEDAGLETPFVLKAPFPSAERKPGGVFWKESVLVKKFVCFDFVKSVLGSFEVKKDGPGSVEVEEFFLVKKFVEVEESFFVKKEAPPLTSFLGSFDVKNEVSLDASD
mmetsp:Transcript_40214/g.97078  ORF Transcript_40214/g.97078 Transcript_40214/m.97078 type:complete len:123 (-) Transcript_40214:1647-2015(-)